MARTTVMRCACAAFLATLVWAGQAGAQRDTHKAVAQVQEAGSRNGRAAVMTEAPFPWIQEDPGAEAYSAARGYLNAGQYREAAEAFFRLRRDHPSSGYLADSYYYQSFALSRLGGRSDLREARELLRAQLDEYPSASTLGDARELLVRVEGQLARQGDVQAAAAITQQAQEACGPDQEMRVAALSALLNMNPDRAVPLLREVLEDRDACSVELRRQAVFLISQKMTDESVDILLDLAHRDPDPDPEVREQAVFWLSQVRSEEALQALESILSETDDRELQENALFAISQHGSERSGQLLRQFAERSDVPSELRADALFHLGQTQEGREYVMSIYARLDDPELKANVLHAVGQGGDDASRQWLMDRARDPSEDMKVRGEALFWASQSRAFGIAELRGLFSSFDDPELKEQVLFAASQRSEPEAVDFLMEVAENPENGELREQAIFWLGQSEDPRVPEFLLGIIGR